MKLVCSHDANRLPELSEAVLPVLLYARADTAQFASAGAAVIEQLHRCKYQPAQRAADFLSLALSVVTADLAIPRNKSPDGWTREIELSVAVVDPDFWISQADTIQMLLRFLTTDIWRVTFTPDGYSFCVTKDVERPNEQLVALLSGGADSLVGALDLVANDKRPLVVSQTVHGDGEKQGRFANEIGGGLRHLQMNHNAKYRGEGDRDQRARSIIFLAYGVLAATVTQDYQDGANIPLFVSENGFISVNPPLTEARVGSLSTRTTHPVYMNRLQEILDSAGLRVELRNPYQLKTKGEMFAECGDQSYLMRMAHVSTSCSRFRTFGLRHCGRCVPCMIRRAAFHRWGFTDQTSYEYVELGKADGEHAGYDDVRSAAMALATADTEGIDTLLGATLSSSLILDPAPLREVVRRGLNELRSFLDSIGMR